MSEAQMGFLVLTGALVGMALFFSAARALCDWIATKLEGKDG